MAVNLFLAKCFIHGNMLSTSEGEPHNSLLPSLPLPNSPCRSPFLDNLSSNFTVILASASGSVVKCQFNNMVGNSVSGPLFSDQIDPVLESLRRLILTSLSLCSKEKTREQAALLPLSLWWSATVTPNETTSLFFFF